MLKFIKLIFKYYSSTEAKWFLYVSIAVLLSIYTALDKYTNFSDLSPLKWVLLIIFSILQGLTAWRAFTDQSLSRDKINSTTVPSLSGRL